MSDADDDTPPDDAGEYVLGTLPAAEADALRERLPRDAALAARVYRWQDRLLPLTRRVPAVEPSPALWRRIEAAVDATATAPAATSPRPAAPQRTPWWQRLGLWQALGAAAVAASLVLGVLLLQRLAAPEPERYLALLQAPGGGRTGWVVELQAGGALRLVPLDGADAVPEGRALQFWTKPQGAAAPTSLGLVQPGRALELPVARLPAVEAQQLFEITLEPAGGSPLGRPTGPILYVGRTLRL